MTEVERRRLRGAAETVTRPQSDVEPRRGRWMVISVVTLVVGGIVGWAIATVVTPPKDVLDSSSFTYVEVVDGEVGSSINLNTVAQWEPVPVGSNQVSGVVTSINVEPGQEVSSGTVLYTVNLRPVVIAQGDVPAFRTLASGSSGADVNQLQSMLSALGYYEGAIDGRFGTSTTRAVKAWQRSSGLAQDGVVQLGDVVFVPTLPARVSLDTDVLSRGASLSGGEDVVRSLPPEPKFTVPVTDNQAGLMPPGTRVEIHGPEGASWEAYVADQTVSSDDASAVVALAGKEGASICGEQCSSIPVFDRSLLPSRIVTVEAASGLVVPTSALKSDPNGQLLVVGQDETEYQVVILASAKGMAVITGVARGTMVRVPADSQ